MVKGIGTDIVKIERLNGRVINRILSDSELKIYHTFSNENRKKEFAAGRFAVKESLFKALETSFDFKKIEVLKNDKGEPYLSDKTITYLKNVIGDFNIKLSISHEKEYAIAFVIVEGVD
ncbi:holo-ACP synthase [Geotoga petraea]|jgi:holo-[acyl-carrier protein] synthase|uniref:Holo-[acyl-carrier-protein] synthase n=1 Tax=Geotoga petraea TaxID=28234 RepID=A0A1G6N2U7_9BACT|nr:holo-ACP synthase [Geotoga petraea]MDK2945550.1 holo-[acyl-carrier protein] synthase [Geotoga sp.]TGG87255.1 holo-[acyl-carrier-protein] synthase [Geotoga petraea]SDC62178.1 holo-[acyl-carrier protein] synthase [Geotoga petraea]